MTLTLGAAIARFGREVDEHHDREAPIPVTSSLQAQGYLLVVPLDPRVERVGPGPAGGRRPVPPGGVGVEGLQRLFADGPVSYASTVPDDANAYYAFDRAPYWEILLGVLIVPVGSTAYLTHPARAYAGIGPGTYELRRQRREADLLRAIREGRDLSERS